MHIVYHALVSATKKLRGLNKLKLVSTATFPERSQPSFTAITHASSLATNRENWTKIGRVHFEKIGPNHSATHCSALDADDQRLRARLCVRLLKGV